MKKTCRMIALLAIALSMSAHTAIIDAGFAGEGYPRGGIVAGKTGKYFDQWVNSQLKMIRSGNSPLTPELWVLPKRAIVHFERSAMVKLINASIQKQRTPSVNSLRRAGYIILGGPVFCRVVESRGGSAIVYVLAIDKKTGSVAKFYTHCNFLQDVASSYKRLEH